MPLRFTGALLGIVLLALSLGAVAPPAPSIKPPPPRSPQDEQKTFVLPPGFRIELVAAEPAIVDPVAFAFDEEGRLFVAEMRGYPNKGVGTGVITSGRIRLLEDRDGDGFYETSTVYADNLRFPTGLMPWRGGLLVANAPELIYLEDTKGTGKADRRRTLYTGFDLANIQQLLNSLQWGLDNRVHACAGGKGGDIRSAEKPSAPLVSLRGRGIRFHPDAPASLEPTSGGGQYGLSPDDWGRWFTATNSQHLRHIVLPDHYLRRNPSLPVGAVTLDIPEHGAACKVFRTSAFEAWRVERTTRRAGGPDARRFPRTELVPGGYVTSACSPLVYTADAFPAEYRGSVFVCDPANNLVLRDVLVPHGATFIARRGHKDSEFLTSTDNWFRPVNLTLGPDGAIYLLDFYRPVIETPLSLPDDIQKRLDLESQGKGRIWRITTAKAGKRHPRPSLKKAPTRDLVARLADPNLWWRITAQRLLIERGDRGAVKPLEELARTSRSAVGRAHALWTLDGFGALDEGLMLKALADPEPGVREQALRLADARLPGSKILQSAVIARAGDEDARVRFQAAFSLGYLDTPAAVAGLAKIARHEATDNWTQTAILSSSSHCAAALLDVLAGDREFARGSAHLGFLTRLASLVAAGGKEADLARALKLGGAGKEATPLRLAILDGIGQGMQNTGRPLARLWESPPPALRDAVGRAKELFDGAVAVARDAKQPLAQRVAAVRLLGRGPFAPLAEVAPALLTPREPPEVQLATARALSAHEQPRVAGLLLAGWPGASPAVRRELLEALFARADRLPALVEAMEKKTVLPAQVEPARLGQLSRHRNPALRARVKKLLAGQATPERRKVVEAYRGVLDLEGDAVRGKAAFKKVCATCHRLEGVGHEVGADLLAALRNKSAEALLIDVLDPSREVDPRYLNYLVRTRRGTEVTGMIAAETASSLTLKRGENAQDTVLRTQIESVEATGKSLMPDGLEMQLSKQDLADVIAYLLRVGRGK
jgi:putative membrane-bound dehydrogenase-like protein